MNVVQFVIMDAFYSQCNVQHELYWKFQISNEEVHLVTNMIEKFKLGEDQYFKIYYIRIF